MKEITTLDISYMIGYCSKRRREAISYMKAHKGDMPEHEEFIFEVEIEAAGLLEDTLRAMLKNKGKQS